MPENKSFDSSAPFGMPVLRTSGELMITVRFPSDEELIEHQRQRKIIIKQLGRGASESVVPNSEDVDAALVEKIRTGTKDAEISTGEAVCLLERLLQCDVDDVVKEGAIFRVITRVAGTTTEHAIDMPSADDVIKYRRQYARVLDLPHGKQQLTVNLAAVPDLYKKLCTSQVNYSGPVPITHQRTALNAAIEESQRIQEVGNF